MNCQSLFCRKNKKNISKCHLLKILPSMLSIKVLLFLNHFCYLYSFGIVQTICMKCQSFFSGENMKNITKCHQLKI